jgi:hypothetical protein
MHNLKAFIEHFSNGYNFSAAQLKALGEKMAQISLPV